MAESSQAYRIQLLGRPFTVPTDVGDIPVTLEMKTSFIKPVKSDTIVAEARIIHVGSQIVVNDVEVRNNEKDLIAKSLVTYYLVEEAKSDGR